MLTTGMRIEEARALKWADVDIRKRVICVRKSKTAQGVRSIPIISDALLKRLHGTKNGQPVYVFQTANGTMMRYENMRRALVHILDEAGINMPKGHMFHTFRHTFASYIIRFESDRVPLASLSRILGHTDVSTTMRIYQHHIKDDNERILSAFKK